MFFPAVGFSINTLALLGLVLAVGLVVDDAIVVVEAIEAKIEQGRSPKDAALEAMDEVGGALVGIALVLSAVFIPAGFMAGITGSLYRQFALTIAFSVLLSCLQRADPESGARRIAVASKKRQTTGRGPLARFFGMFNAGFARTQNGYVRICDLLIRKVARCDRCTGGLCGACGRPWKDSAAIIPARRRPGLLSDERRAAAGCFARAHQRIDEADRRDPEERAGIRYYFDRLRLQHPLPHQQQPQRSCTFASSSPTGEETESYAIRSSPI